MFIYTVHNYNGLFHNSDIIMSYLKEENVKYYYEVPRDDFLRNPYRYTRTGKISTIIGISYSIIIIIPNNRAYLLEEMNKKI